MWSKICVVIFLAIFFAYVISATSDGYQEWHSKVFGHKNNFSKTFVPKSIVRVRCRSGWIRIGTKCVEVIDYFDDP
ncbi:unnamed protein product [Tenebrio molitor]|nr:unnamed protein product [Tenebrio molitor]